ncbi:PAS domain-containing protein [Paracoccus spongiarum]|uniref:PAS domain-containing protein n=1 Tax=Paracoccus spongiarum TaxID=3064387 RepID=A0ABT9J8Q9_9RHOB|nr:PAS domain-containing protein [Paracoccus sp. 2205BS29-5]MDP5306015.1 PAS domain-containing protein [Paracoccus sp. 2205BS29-5]
MPPAGTGAASAQLIRLADFDRAQPARLLIEMRDYWQGLRRGRAVPARADIEPRGIHRVLDYAFILERIAPGAARFRLAGRHLIDLMGMEVRGMPVCAFLNPRSRGRFSDVLESVFKAPQIAELRLHGKAEYARPQLEARMLLLPLRSDLGDVTRALGCLIAEGTPGVAPRRFDLIEDAVSPIIEGGSTLAPTPSACGMAEDAAPYGRVDRILSRGRDRRAQAAPPAEAPPAGTMPATDPAARPAASPARHPDPAPAATPQDRRALFRIVSTDGS